MEVAIERHGTTECLETLVTNLKNNVSLWEEFVTKTFKLNTSIKGTLQCSSGFLETFQKLADCATGNPASGLRDLGAMLTRFCIRQRGLENKVISLNSHLIDSLALPLQDRMEDWRRTNAQFERDRQKSWRRARTDLHKASADVTKLRKKAEKKGSTGPDTRLQLEFAEQDLSEKKQALDDIEKSALRKAVVEDRRRYAELLSFLKPVLDTQLALFNEMSTLEELFQTLYSASKDPSELPEETEAWLRSLDDPQTNGHYSTISSRSHGSGQTPSIHSHSNQAPSSCGSKDAQSVSQLSISSSSSDTSTTPNGTSLSAQGTLQTSNNANYSFPMMGTKMASNRVPSVTSQDSGFTSHEPKKPQTNNSRNSDSCDVNSLLEDISTGWLPGNEVFDDQNQPDTPPSTATVANDHKGEHSNGTIKRASDISDRNGSISVPTASSEEDEDGSEDETDEDDEGDEDDVAVEVLSYGRDQLSSKSPGLSRKADAMAEGSTAVNPSGMSQLRRHTIADQGNMGGNSTFKPSSFAGAGANDGRRQSLYPNQAIPPPIYANMSQLQSAARRKYGHQVDEKKSAKKESKKQAEEKTASKSRTESPASSESSSSRRGSASGGLTGVDILLEPPPDFRSKRGGQMSSSSNYRSPRGPQTEEDSPVSSLSLAAGLLDQDLATSCIPYPPVPGWDPQGGEGSLYQTFGGDTHSYRAPTSTYATISRKTRKPALPDWVKESPSSIPTTHSPPLSSKQRPRLPSTPSAPTTNPPTPPSAHYDTPANQLFTNRSLSMDETQYYLRQQQESHYRSTADQSQYRQAQPASQSQYRQTQSTDQSQYRQTQPADQSQYRQPRSGDQSQYRQAHSLDQSNSAEYNSHYQQIQLHAQIQAQQLQQLQQRQQEASSRKPRQLVRRSSSSSRTATPEHNNSNGVYGVVTPGMTKNSESEQRGGITSGVRVRYPSASGRPNVPPKPRMSMYGVLPNGQNPGVIRGREGGEEWRKRRDEVCTSFMGTMPTSANGATDISNYVTPRSAMVPQPPSHSALPSNHQPHSNTPPYQRYQPFQPAPSSFHLGEQPSDRHLYQSKSPRQPVAGFNPEVVDAIRQGVQLRKIGNTQGQSQI